MTQTIIALLTILLSNTLFTSNAFAATQISTTIDKNPIVVNESFILKITIDDDVDTNALNTSALLKDFVVGRTSVSSQTSMVNFKTTQTTTWTTLLIGKSAGDFIIPPFTIAGINSQAIKVQILAENDPLADKQQDIFITTEISAKEVYVQQQLTLTVKLHFAAELKRGSLSEPTLESASITQIGKDKEEDTIINGRRYRVIERTYAISPKNSGEFTLKSPLFSGEILVPSTRRNNMFSFSETKPVSVIGDEIQLLVRPIPETFQGTWLPSNLLAIHQDWQPDLTTFKVGEPITRIITLTAAGLSEEQLPLLEMTVPKGLKVYPDQAQLHTGMSSGHLVSQKVRNFAIVASKPGEYQLPEISIPWWNTVTNRYQIATIAAQKITVLPNSELNTAPAVMKNQQNKVLIPTETIVVTQASWLQWLFLTLWLLTALAWFISAKRSKPLTVKTTKIDNRNNNPYLSLLAACKKNQGLEVLALISPWINTLQAKAGNKITATLDDALIEINDNKFQEEIELLQQCYYGKEQKKWQGKALTILIQAINKQGLKVNEAKVLTLNPR
ncbi:MULTISPECIES: BatD family protein [unclassified Colwellia]|uniref:BatD family protein n=1 Tax=unclassified Colwellia TaxID=196834 RepID=UPI0015F65A02|nr:MULTISPECIES: BatD family protein [unclassified Colwellia]MBA6355626.1 protein BatD [Colwellia sp. BRX8-3]MBA6360562.1 protein BatD [Colwellia sp. BRX8-6]MBA6367749.1 protein BatD [Colwellia sp. BRX8-5]MBA6376480.1 protein BatD [Colwellia sp. BRX8-2]